jgi:hypothetical protein
MQALILLNLITGKNNPTEAELNMVLKFWGVVALILVNFLAWSEAIKAIYSLWY